MSFLQFLTASFLITYPIVWMICLKASKDDDETDKFTMLVATLISALMLDFFVLMALFGVKLFVVWSIK